MSNHGRVEQAKQTARDAVRDNSDWIERLGRLGYAAKGVVYAIIGALAIQVALGRGGETTDSRGALRAVAAAPFGQALLAALTVGLAGYALWRFVQAFADTENQGREAKGLARRALYAGIGLIYAGLALSAIRLLRGAGGETATRSWTARLMAQPLGQWLVGLAGAALIGLGLYQLVKAWRASFQDKLNLAEMSERERRWAVRGGRAGHAARGIVFGIGGLLVINAARHANPAEDGGIDGALRELAAQQHGPWLLGATAAGLLAYAVFCGVEARYRRMIIR